MKLYCYPKKQDLYLVYSSYQAFRSKIFKNLIIQSSPKNSLFFRFLRTNIGYRINSIFKTKIEVPNNNCDYAGIIKKEKIILFELQNNQPVFVWKKNNTNWIKEKFLGYQLISEYTYNEFLTKQKLIEKALAIQWKNLNQNPVEVHGDFTHFNILHDSTNNIYFIDNKKHKNSKLFDFFYFYAYIRQSITRCSTLSTLDKLKILSIIESTIKTICQYPTKEEFIKDYDSISIPNVTGLMKKNKDIFLNDFFNLF